MRKTLVVLLLALFVFALPVVAVAETESPYDKRVVDNANVFSASELTDIWTAADELADLIGASVHVVTVKSVGSAGNLDMLIGEIVDSTPSWRSPNGGMKASLLVFAIAMEEREAAIYFADPGLWSKAFERHPTTRIEDDFMFPNFADGDVAKGFISGMRETGRVLDAYLRPPEPTTPKPPATVPKEPKPAKEPNPAVTYALLSLLGVVVLFCLIVFGTKLVRRMKSEKAERKRQERQEAEAREVARQNALRLRDATSSVLNAFRDATALTVLKAKVARYSKADPSRADDLAMLMARFESSYESSTSKLLAAVSASANPEDEGLAIGVYEAMADRYESALNDAKAAQKAAEGIDKLAESIQKELNSVANKIADLATQFANTEKKIEEIKALKLDVSTEVQALTLEKERFDALKVKNDGSITVVGVLKKCASTLQDINGSLDELRELYNKARELKLKLPPEILEAEQLIGCTQSIFDELEAKYAETSWESIAGNGSWATEMIKEAKERMALADEFLKKNDVREAYKELRLISDLVAKAINLLRAISNRKLSLQKASERAPEEFRLAQIDIDKAIAYVNSHLSDVDVQKHRASIEDAESDLAIAKAEYAKAKPDLDIVIEKALEANHDADHILELCMSEHEQAERQRRQAKEAMRKLESDFNEAVDFLNNNSGDIGSKEKQALQEARVAYDRAKSATDAALIISLANAAMRHTDSAYSQAQRNVRDAEAERERIRAEERRRQQQQNDDEERRRRAAATSATSSYHSPYSSTRSPTSSSLNSRPSSISGSSRGFGSSGGSPKIGGSSRKW